jgi:hypothetical protein
LIDAPCRTKAGPPWQLLLQAVYKSVAAGAHAIVYSPLKSSGGGWIRPADAVAVESDAAASEADSAGSGDAKADGKRLLLESKSGDGKSAAVVGAVDSVSAQLAALLLRLELPVVTLPSRMRRLLAEHGAEPRHATPAFVRAFLAKNAAALRAAKLSRGESLFLLRFCACSDLAKSKAFAQLAGVPLLPLADGSFGTFAANSDGTVFAFRSFRCGLLSMCSSSFGFLCAASSAAVYALNEAEHTLLLSSWSGADKSPAAAQVP